ncbi:MAG TPA: activator of HSP90 ATPase 1 family protein [Phaeodactylibacter sp.]|nr:activator of HSP90 ATPase 1 family protein [Phaeodactylibacter sp.]
MKRVQLDLEFIFRASPTILYKFLTTPSCLIRWFCDEVDINKGVYDFIWSGAGESATLIDDIEDERIRFRWEDSPEGEYFEFRMSKSPVTAETVLEITDFCDEDEVEDQKQLWESQMKILRQEMGG